MDENVFFASSVPVFRHYLGQIEEILTRLEEDHADEIKARLVTNMFSAGEHFRTAQGFVLRTVFPLMGRPIPDLSTEATSLADLRQRSREILAMLEGLEPADFGGAHARMIAHQAGTAQLEQDGFAFLTQFALPNFFFHLTMGYATLRQRGIGLGKRDFDGQHRYPRGFRFPFEI